MIRIVLVVLGISLPVVAWWSLRQVEVASDGHGAREHGRFPLPNTPDSQPIMTVFVGPNGTGKSTLRDELSQPFGAGVGISLKTP